MDRGMQFAKYKTFVSYLINGKTDNLSRKEYKNRIIEMMCDDLEKNHLGGHFYPENCELDYHNSGCIGRFKITYRDGKDMLNITLLGDCVSVNNMYIPYC